jgi:hypothetical protein
MALPKGNKNAPKFILTVGQVKLAEKLGVSLETYAYEMSKMKKQPKTPPKTPQKKTNWEKLARELQAALKSEIDENIKLVDDKNGLIARVESLEFDILNLKHQAIGYQAVVSYLENKLGYHSV